MGLIVKTITCVFNQSSCTSFQLGDIVRIVLINGAVIDGTCIDIGMNCFTLLGIDGQNKSFVLSDVYDFTVMRKG